MRRPCILPLKLLNSSPVYRASWARAVARAPSAPANETIDECSEASVPGSGVVGSNGGTEMDAGTKDVVGPGYESGDVKADVLGGWAVGLNVDV